MKVLRKKPVAKFFYQGNHSHPVRRTVILDQNTSEYISGYEIRSGNDVFTLQDAPYKKYIKSKIARVGDYSRIRRTKKYMNISADTTTLERLELLEVINNS